MHVLNMRLTGHQQIDHALVDIVADDAKASLGKFHCQGQADIAKSDDTDYRRSIVDSGEQLLLHHSVSTCRKVIVNDHKMNAPR